MQLKSASRIVFALTMISIGIIGLVSGGFAPIWAGVPKTLPGRQLLAYLCTTVSLVCGLGLLARRTATWVALALLVYLVAWTVLFKVPFIIRAPLVEVSYQTTGENLVLIGAALVLWCEGAKGRMVLSGAAGLRIANLLYGVALIAFGFSHFAYLNLTAPLVPAWLQAPVFWAYLTGCVYLATGLMLVSGFAVRLGTALAGLQILLITILVWGPMLATRDITAMHWQETVVSWALTAAAFVLATSFDERRLFEPLGNSALPRRNAGALR